MEKVVGTFPTFFYFVSFGQQLEKGPPKNSKIQIGAEQLGN